LSFGWERPTGLTRVGLRAVDCFYKLILCVVFRIGDCEFSLRKSAYCPGVSIKLPREHHAFCIGNNGLHKFSVWMRTGGYVASSIYYEYFLITAIAYPGKLVSQVSFFKLKLLGFHQGMILPIFKKGIFFLTLVAKTNVDLITYLEKKAT